MSGERWKEVAKANPCDARLPDGASSPVRRGRIGGVGRD